ncbi:MAG: hypothetical protein HY665_00975 [Chloroflexi bacterium]|nr:hypothetical protein [Chloroflexota bacterium]
MWKNRKFILIAGLVALVLIASVAGIALAQTGSTDNATPGKTLLGRVATILGIDQQKVESAFIQAQREMQNEALDNYLKNLVEQGKITQQQADQYKSWWQSRPADIPAGLGFPGHPGKRGPGPGGWGKMNIPIAPAAPTSPTP